MFDLHLPGKFIGRLLYFLRHGDADEDHGEGDAARRLTPKGEREALQLERETVEELRGGPFDSLSLAAGHGDVLFVGHEPDFSNEVARLTGAKVKLRKGGLAIVDGSTLTALLRPHHLAALAGTSD